MDRKETGKESHLPYPVEELLRRRRRLKKDLGLSDEAIEVIMKLRGQLIFLQARLREVESQLESQQSGQGARLAWYRQMSYEAVWKEAVEE